MVLECENDDEFAENNSFLSSEEHAFSHDDKFSSFEMEGKKYHKCDHCAMAFPFKTYLDQHIQSIHPNIKLPFSCNLCGKSFAKQMYLENHARGHMEKLHKCKHCDKAFVRISLLKRHLTSHDHERPHKCKECGKTFRDSFDLKRHYRLHSGERPFICDFCGKGFPQKVSLMFHLKIHTGEMPYKCNVCTKAFRRPQNLKNHKQIHFALSEGNKNRSFSCMDCGMQISNVSEFEVHIETHHYKNSGITNKENSDELNSDDILKEQNSDIDTKPLLCVHCGACFNFFDDYEKHVLSHERKLQQDNSSKTEFENRKLSSTSGSEDDGKIYTCQECGCGFKTKSSCNRHIQMAHQEFICEICNKLFKNMKFFQDHLPLHSQYLKENLDKTNVYFSCPHCGQNFSTQDTLNKHVASHDPSNIHQCEFCDACFNNFESLQNHRSNHLTDRKVYQCDLCDKSFVRHFALFNHLQVHANKSYFKCQSCSKCFSSKEHLDQHSRIHRGEVPYKCIDCGIGFYTSYKFKEHRVVHSEKHDYLCLDCKIPFATKKLFDRHKKLHEMRNKIVDDWSDEEWYHQI